MGPMGLTNALPRGGPYKDDFPVNWTNYLDGIIAHHWETEKAPSCTITDCDDVPRFVS